MFLTGEGLWREPLDVLVDLGGSFLRCALPGGARVAFDVDCLAGDSLFLLSDLLEVSVDDRLLLFLLVHVGLPCGDRRLREREESESLELEEVEVSDSSVFLYRELQAGHLSGDGGNSGSFIPFVSEGSVRSRGFNLSSGFSRS